MTAFRDPHRAGGPPRAGDNDAYGTFDRQYAVFVHCGVEESIDYGREGGGEG